MPVVVTQHMPPNFTQSLASRLNTLSKVEVVEAQGKEKLEPNVVYIAKGGYHLKFKKLDHLFIQSFQQSLAMYLTFPELM